MEAFRGNHPAKVEDGGRLKLPGPFKKIVDDAQVTQFYMTSTDGVSAQIWPLPEWESRKRCWLNPAPWTMRWKST
jgi:MraZ protein